MSAAGMDSGAVFTATALVCFLGTCVMALLTNYPFVLVPSMGFNAYFAYTVVLGMGYTWEVALVAIFLEVVVFALISMFLSPIFLAIPSFATAPALVIVGFLMASSVLKIDFNNPCEGIPAFLCFMGMPLCYSIVEGISLGIISYVCINLLCGNHKKISPMMYVLAVVFVIKYVLI